MTTNLLAFIAEWRSRPGPSGLPSICSAHPLVLEAAMRVMRETDLPLLIEATCNQVNQEGGYTGLTPADFRVLVETIAADCGFPIERVLLGGDHLGPNPWKDQTDEVAMDKAETMVRAYAAAGFNKLHLDCSMGCRGEKTALNNATSAERTVRLAAAAESARHHNAIPPVYIIGTEVPAPGGATETLDKLEVTSPEAAYETVAVHRAAFMRAGFNEAFDRVVGLVVQPGVEFGNHNVIPYDPIAARNLSAVLDELPRLVFEAHSTDYQTPQALASMVADGFAFLKVGPGLTFAMRDALYSLDALAEELFPNSRSETLKATMERLMMVDPSYWQSYYEGNETERKHLRHTSLSDRIRYYWPHREAEAAIKKLFKLLEAQNARDVVLEDIGNVIRNYVVAASDL